MDGSEDTGFEKVMREIKDLVRSLEGSGVAKLTVEKGDLKIGIERTPGKVVGQAAPALGLEDSSKQAPSAGSQDTYEVLSPLVGVFYRASKPGAKPFVEVGDLIDAGTVIGIVEAMKVMNEIRCEVGGRVAKILVENGQPVQYDQPLVLIERASVPAASVE